VRIAIILVVLLLALTGNGPVGVNERTVPDAVPGQREVEQVGGPVDLTKGDGRDQHFALAEEATGRDHQMANGPPLVVEQKVDDPSDVTVRCGRPVFLELLEASQHGSPAGSQ
jgi:hypothetical protein